MLLTVLVQGDLFFWDFCLRVIYMVQQIVETTYLLHGAEPLLKS